MEQLRRPVVERLPRYYHYLHERVQREKITTISSKSIADAMHVDDTLVRRDLASIGVRGQPRIGYRTADVLNAIRTVLGFDRESRAMLVGAGRLGQALAAYPGFPQYGLRIVAAIDSDPAKRGMRIDHLTVAPPDDLNGLVRGHHIEIAILTLPAEAAQRVAEELVAAGVPAFWNFAPVHLELPEGIHVRNEVLSVGLATVTYRLKDALTRS